MLSSFVEEEHLPCSTRVSLLLPGRWSRDRADGSGGDCNAATDLTGGKPGDLGMRYCGYCAGFYRVETGVEDRRGTPSPTLISPSSAWGK